MLRVESALAGLHALLRYRATPEIVEGCEPVPRVGAQGALALDRTLVVEGTLDRSRDTAWTMSQENVERARKAYEREGMDGWIALLTEHARSDVEWIPDRRVGEGAIRGRDKVIEFFTDRASVFGEMEFEVEQTWDRGEQVLLFLRVSGSGSTSGAGFDIRIAHLWTLKDGGVVRGEGFGDRDEALKAAGLPE